MAAYSPGIGVGKGCGGATKANCSYCAGPGCTKSNPCASDSCKKPGSTCTVCSNGGTTCKITPPAGGGAMPKLPPVVYEWWQIPTKVTINGKPCASCLVPGGKNRSVTLTVAQLKAAGPSVAVHISFGSAASE